VRGGGGSAGLGWPIVHSPAKDYCMDASVGMVRRIPRPSVGSRCNVGLFFGLIVDCANIILHTVSTYMYFPVLSTAHTLLVVAPCPPAKACTKIVERGKEITNKTTKRNTP